MPDHSYFKDNDMFIVRRTPRYYYYPRDRYRNFYWHQELGPFRKRGYESEYLPLDSLAFGK